MNSAEASQLKKERAALEETVRRLEREKRELASRAIPEQKKPFFTQKLINKANESQTYALIDFCRSELVELFNAAPQVKRAKAKAVYDNALLEFVEMAEDHIAIFSGNEWSLKGPGACVHVMSHEREKWTSDDYVQLVFTHPAYIPNAINKLNIAESPTPTPMLATFEYRIYKWQI